MGLMNLNAQNEKRAVAELFTNKSVGEYDSIIKIFDAEGIDFIADHYRDELENPDVLKRLTHMNAWSIPSVFINGQHLADNKILNPRSYSAIKEWTGLFDCDPEVNTSITYIDYIIPNIKILNVSITLPVVGNDHLITVMVDETFPAYRNVMRCVVMEDSAWNGNEMKKSIQLSSTWNLKNCKLLVIVEDDQHQTIGSCHEPLITNTGIEQIETKIKIYPNPALGQFTIESTSPIGILSVFSLNGKMVFSEKIESNTVKLSLKKGVYFVKIKGESKRVIVL